MNDKAKTEGGNSALLSLEEVSVAISANQDHTLEEHDALGGSTEFFGYASISVARALVLFCVGANDFCVAFGKAYFPLTDYLTATALVRRGYSVLSSAPSHDHAKANNRPNVVTATEVFSCLEKLPVKYRLLERPESRQRIADAANTYRCLCVDGAEGGNKKADRMWQLRCILEAISTAETLPQCQDQPDILSALAHLDHLVQYEIDRIRDIEVPIGADCNPAIWRRAAPVLEALLSPALIFGPSQIIKNDNSTKKGNSDKNDNFDNFVEFRYGKSAYRPHLRGLLGDLLAIENAAAVFPASPPPEITDQNIFHPDDLRAPSARHLYRSFAGHPLLAVYLFAPSATAKKSQWERKTQTYGSRGGVVGWGWEDAAERIAPLYGLERLARSPNSDVVFVASETAADTLQAFLPDVVVMTSLGGRRGVDRVDWSPLAERRVIFWPGYDDAEKAYLARARRYLTDRGDTLVRLVSLKDSSWPQNWSLNDGLPPGTTATYAEQLISAAKKTAPPRTEGVENWHGSVRELAAGIAREWHAAGMRNISVRTKESTNDSERHSALIQLLLDLIGIQGRERASKAAAIRMALTRDAAWQSETKEICKHLMLFP